MTRVACIFLVLACFAATGGAASAADVVFQGRMAVESLTDACNSPGVLQVDDLVDTIYRPASLGSNGLTTGLAFTIANIMVSGITVSGPINSDPQPATVQTAVTQRNLSLRYSKYSAKISGVFQNPSVLTDDPPFYYIEFVIDNFENISGCSAKIIGVLVSL